MGYVDKKEVYKVLHQLLGIPIKTLEIYTDEQLITGIRLAHNIYIKK